MTSPHPGWLAGYSKKPADTNPYREGMLEHEVWLDEFRTGLACAEVDDALAAAHQKMMESDSEYRARVDQFNLILSGENKVSQKVMEQSAQLSQSGSGIPSGFGKRLKEERKRLQFTQEQFAAAGGVRRLAQVSYEKGATSPTLEYLSNIAGAGVNLAYLVLGVRPVPTVITQTTQERIERKAFELVEQFLTRATHNGLVTAESRWMLFRLFRNSLMQVGLGLPADFDPAALVESL